MNGKSRMISGLGPLVVVAFFSGPAMLLGHSERERSAPLAANQDTKCLASENLANALAQLSGGYAEAHEARATLLKAAARSRMCREHVISLIMNAMDKPDIDIRRNQATYYLWREGSDLLGELRATQALDLLISHLGINDGEWSASMVHQPALGGIIKIGPIAIPKLSAALGSSDPNLRHDAVYCIALIGGRTALSALKQALPSESDQCVRRFIRISISSLDNEKNILKNDAEWFSAFLCK